MGIAACVACLLLCGALVVFAAVKLFDAGLRITELESLLLQEKENKKFAITYRDTDAAMLRLRVKELESDVADLEKRYVMQSDKLDNAIKVGDAEFDALDDRYADLLVAIRKSRVLLGEAFNA